MSGRQLLILSDTKVFPSKKANDYCRKLALSCGIRNAERIPITTPLKFKNQPATTLLEEVKFCAKTGTAGVLQKSYDQQNRLFNIGALLPIGIAAEQSLGATFKISNDQVLGKPSSSMFHYHPLQQISDDILLMRRLCVEHSASALNCLPYYFSYLTLSISIIDAYVSYCSKYLSDMRGNASFSPYVGELFLKSGRQSRRLEILWNTLFLDYKARTQEYQTIFFGLMDETIAPERLKRSFQVVKSSRVWEDYLAIKNARNEHVHPNEHVAQIYIEDIAENLNKIRGLGGLLLDFTRHNSVICELGFLRKLNFAPKISMR